MKTSKRQRRRAVAALYDHRTRTRYLLKRRVTVIGRKEVFKSQAHIQLEDREVSRRHAMLVQDRQAVIRDLGSKNGVWVNGRQLQTGQRHVLEPGDEVRLGQSLLVFQVPRSREASKGESAKSEPRGLELNVQAVAASDPLATYLARHDEREGEFRVRLVLAGACAALLGVVAALI